MKQSARWTLSVSADLDRRVRRHLADAGRKRDLSALLQEATRARLSHIWLTKLSGYSVALANNVMRLEPVEEQELLDVCGFGG